MIVKCPKCKMHYHIDMTRIPTKGAHVRCRSCQTRFFVLGMSNVDKITAPAALGKLGVAFSPPNTESQQEIASQDKEEAISKLPIEEFVRRAIINLREPPEQGIPMTHSGFAEAYREYYGLDPEKEIEKLAQEGKVIAKEEAGGILIYLPQDVAGSHQENKLPNSLGSTDLKDTTVRTASAPKKIDGNSESAKDNIKPDNSKLLDILSPVHQPPVAVDASQYPAARYCLSCGAKLINFTGVKRCSYCGAPVEAIENAREALIDPFASESIPTQSILTNTNEHTTESFPHYLIWVNIGIWLFFSYLHSKFSYDLRFPPAN